MNPNKRKSSETLEQYHKRLRAQKKVEKILAKGSLLWNSSRRGTYIKPSSAIG